MLECLQRLIQEKVLKCIRTFFKWSNGHVIGFGPANVLAAPLPSPCFAHCVRVCQGVQVCKQLEPLSLVLCLAVLGLVLPLAGSLLQAEQAGGQEVLVAK